MQAFILVDGAIRETSDPAEVQKAHAEGRKLWVDLDARTPECVELLGDTFKIHPLVVEDLWFERTVPKLDRYPDYTYIIVHGIRRSSDPLRVELWVLDVIFGNNFIITEHGDSPALSAIRSQIPRLPKLLGQGPAWVAHAFIDSVIDRYGPLVDEIGQKIEEAEHGVVTRGSIRSDSMLPLLTGLKRSIQTLHRIAFHQKDTLRRLAYEGYAEIPPDAVPYFRDVHDHFVRVSDLVEAYRDVMGNAIEAYLSLQSNQMNEIVKTLTLMSTIVLPLSFIAGVYGMNFRNLPAADSPYGFFMILGVMAAVAAGIALAFRRRGWI